MVNKIHPYLIPGIKNYKYTPEIFLSDVCKFFNITEDQLKSKSRQGVYRMPRQVFLNFAVIIFKYSGLTYEAASAMVNRDHSTVNNSQKAVNNLYDTDKHFKQVIDEFNKYINERIELFENKDEISK